MNTEQYVMAYGAEHDRLRAVLPDGFKSLRPVLRINAEIRNSDTGYVEFNTAVEKDGVKVWLNVGFRDNVAFERNGKIVKFRTDYLEITFTDVGVEGSCPAEKDNDGCFFRSGEEYLFKEAEIISVNKEFCECEFRWNFGENGAHGKSIGKTLPAIPEEAMTDYPKSEFTLKNVAVIPCKQVLGAYLVKFSR